MILFNNFETGQDWRKKHQREDEMLLQRECSVISCLLGYCGPTRTLIWWAPSWRDQNEVWV